MTEKTVQISLSRYQALVLFELLARSFDDEKRKDGLTFVDGAEMWVLSDVFGTLEEELHEPFDPDYSNLVSVARNHIRKLHEGEG